MTRLSKTSLSVPLGVRQASALLCLISLIFLVVSAGSTAHAQDAAQSDEAVESVVQAVTEAGLSDEQAEAVRAIIEDTEREPGALWTAAGAIHEELGTTGTLAYAQALQANRFERRMQRRGTRGPHRGRSAGARPNMNADAVGPGLRDLELTDEQKAQIFDIRSSYREKMRTLRASDTGRPSADTREAMRSLRAEMRSEIESVMTDEQLQQLEERRTQRRDEREARRAAHRAARDGVLNLSDDQKQKLDSLRAAHQQARTELQGQGRGKDRHAHRADGMAAMAEILDDDQEAIVTLHRALRGAILEGTRRPGGPRGAGR